jgi:hypothetical protein
MQSQSLCLRSFMFLLASLAFAHSATAQLLSAAQCQQLQTLIESSSLGECVHCPQVYAGKPWTL